MEEKKLTDEEMLNRLELYARDGIWWDGIVEMHDILDLIHRLQKENEELKSPKFASWKLKFFNLKEEFDKEIAEHEEFTKEANEKIERLNGKYRNLEINYNAVWEDFRKYEIENTKLQKQVDELKEKLWKSKQDMMTYHSKTVAETVKDTAKEILQIVKEKGYDYLWGLEKVIKERYGVEVE